MQLSTSTANTLKTSTLLLLKLLLVTNKKNSSTVLLLTFFQRQKEVFLCGSGHDTFISSDRPPVNDNYSEVCQEIILNAIGP